MSKHLTVLCSALLVATGSLAPAQQQIVVPGDYATIAEAIAAASDGDQILVGAGEWYGAIVTKSLEITTQGGAVIVDGPVHPSGLVMGFRIRRRAIGSTISHLRFEGKVELPVFSNGADDVTVTHCTMKDPVQGITNWAGSRWQITHNKIEGIQTAIAVGARFASGGFGIVIADRDGQNRGTFTEDNVIAHNAITGDVVLHPNTGEVAVGGIAVLADYRDRSGNVIPDKVQENRFFKNHVYLTMDDTAAEGNVLLTGITVANTENVRLSVLLDNDVAFNNLHRLFNLGNGGVESVFLYPEDLAEVTIVERNLVMDGNGRGNGDFKFPDILRPDADA